MDDFVYKDTRVQNANTLFIGLKDQRSLSGIDKNARDAQNKKLLIFISFIYTSFVIIYDFVLDNN